jgi:hypothetical protein
MSTKYLKTVSLGMLMLLQLVAIPACQSKAQRQPQAMTGVTGANENSRPQERSRSQVADRPGAKVHGRSLQ